MTSKPQVCHPPSLAFKLNRWLSETQAKVLADAEKEKQQKTSN